MYLNAYIPNFQYPQGVYSFLRDTRGLPIPSPAALGQIGDAFVSAVTRYAKDHQVPLERFSKGDRKESYVRPYFAAAMAQGRTGTVFIAAQEKARAWRGVLTPEGKAVHQPWFTLQSAEVCVKWIYFYVQLARQGIGFTALDNGFLACDDPTALQSICDRFGPEHLQGLLRRLTTELPLPLTTQDRDAGFDYKLSILQAEISLTQVFDQPAMAVPSSSRPFAITLTSADPTRSRSCSTAASPNARHRVSRPG